MLDGRYGGLLEGLNLLPYKICPLVDLLDYLAVSTEMPVELLRTMGCDHIYIYMQLIFDQLRLWVQTVISLSSGLVALLYLGNMVP